MLLFNSRKMAGRTLCVSHEMIFDAITPSSQQKDPSPLTPTLFFLNQGIVSGLILGALISECRFGECHRIVELQLCCKMQAIVNSERQAIYIVPSSLFTAAGYMSPRNSKQRPRPVPLSCKKGKPFVEAGEIFLFTVILFRRKQRLGEKGLIL